MNPLNPFQENKKSFFGSGLIEGIFNRKRPKPSSYSKMKTNQINKRRAKNKVGYKSRRKNRIIANNLHAKLV